MAWYDLPTLLLHHQQSACLDQSLLLTKGNPANLGAVTLSLINSFERFTAIIEATSASSHLVGQVVHHPNSRVASISFMRMDDPNQVDELPAMIDFLGYHACEENAFNLLAEVEDAYPLYEILRRSGFAVYGLESLWHLQPFSNDEGEADSASWSPALPTDEVAIRSLYQNLTPPVEQSAEFYQSNLSDRLVHRAEDEITAWVEYRTGPLGTYLIPVIHPSIHDPKELLMALSSRFTRFGKPLYLQVRSHQSWLQPSLAELGAQSTGQFTLLVKHLAIAQKSAVTNGQRSRVERAQAKPTVPIIQNLSQDVSALDTKNGLK